MRLMFVYWRIGNAGSAQDILQYSRVACSLGHEVVMYAPEETGSPFECSLDLESADAVVFVFEWNLYLFPGGDKKKGGIYRDGLMGIGHLNVAKLFSRVPRQRRVILDCDGMYNDSLQVDGDFNHPDADASRRRIELCDSLSDKIFQPTYRPLRPNVKPFFFHGYDPSWEVPLDFDNKEFGMIYVGNNWFRWRSLRRVLGTIEPVLQHVGRIAVVGNGWDRPAPWAKPVLPEDAYYHDSEYLRRLGIEVIPPIRFDEVINWMSRGLFSPVIYRPLFDHLQLVTCRTFETPAANTIPLLCQERQFVEDVYGPAGLELILPRERPQEKIIDLIENRQKYLGVVRELRHVLSQRYSYTARVRELVEKV